MSLLDKILKKEKKEPVEIPVPPETKLPEDLEKLRVKPKDEFHRFAEEFSEKKPAEFPPIGSDIGITERKEVDKFDLILARLETINERLKVIEEKLEKRI
jgi:hypothetical protein